MSLLFNKMTQKVVTVGTSAVSMPAIVNGDEVQNPDAVFVQTDDANLGKVYIGKTGVLTNGTTGAFIFSGGDNGILPFTKDEELKLIATIPGQKVYITYLAV